MVKGSLGSHMAPIVTALKALDITTVRPLKNARRTEGRRAMLYNFLYPLAGDFQILNLFRYITFRTGGAIMTALFLSFIFGPSIITWLKSQQGSASNVREDLPETHFKKAGTPTMGGFLILLSISVSTILWADLTNGYVWVVLLVTIGFGAVGFADDYLKLSVRIQKVLPAV